MYYAHVHNPSVYFLYYYYFPAALRSHTHTTRIGRRGINPHSFWPSLSFSYTCRHMLCASDGAMHMILIGSLVLGGWLKMGRPSACQSVCPSSSSPNICDYIGKFMFRFGPQPSPPPQLLNFTVDPHRDNVHPLSFVAFGLLFYTYASLTPIRFLTRVAEKIKMYDIKHYAIYLVVSILSWRCCVFSCYLGRSHLMAQRGPNVVL